MSPKEVFERLTYAFPYNIITPPLSFSDPEREYWEEIVEEKEETEEIKPLLRCVPQDYHDYLNVF